MKNELTFIKMQEIVNNIIEEEKEKYGIELSGGLVNFVQYYKEYLKDDKFNLIKMLNYFTNKGFNDLDGNIVLSLNQINNDKCKGINILELILICYHEFYHSVQEKRKDNSYVCIVNDFEKYIRRFKPIDYSMFHDDYFFEIEANKYAVIRASEYLKEHYYKLFIKLKPLLDNLIKKCDFDIKNYDLGDTVEKVIEIRKARYNSYKGMLDVPVFYDMYMSEDYPEILDVFMSYNCTFKSIKDIVNNPKFKEIDKEIICAFFSCKYFLESVDINILSHEEREVI